MKSMYLIFVSLVALANPVLADDKNFSGPYIGAHVGYAETDISANVGSVYAGIREGGVGYGGSLGMRYQTDGGIVLGIEGHISNNASRFDEASLANLIDLDGASLTTDWQYGGDGIVGVTLGKSKSTLLFASVGYIRGGLKSSYAGESFSDEEDGMRFGLGVETKFSDLLRFRLHSTVSDYPIESIDLEDFGFDGAGNATSSVMETKVTAGLVFQF